MPPVSLAPQAGMTIFGGLPTESHFRSRGELAVAPASGCSRRESSCLLQTRLAGFRTVRLIEVHEFQGPRQSFRGSTAAWHVGVARTPVHNSVTFVLRGDRNGGSNLREALGKERRAENSGTTAVGSADPASWREEYLWPVLGRYGTASRVERMGIPATTGAGGKAALQRVRGPGRSRQRGNGPNRWHGHQRHLRARDRLAAGAAVAGSSGCGG
jgi:hypothetical protein